MTTVEFRAKLDALKSGVAELVSRVDTVTSRVAGLDQVKLDTPLVTSTTSAGDAVAATGWSTDGFVAWRGNDMVQFRVTMTRTGSDITRPASGDIGNVHVCTLAAAWRGTTVTSNMNCNGSGNSGRMAGGVFIPDDGRIFVTSLGGTSNLATNEKLTFGGVFYVG